MSAITIQDQQFINEVRSKGSALLVTDDAAQSLGGMWNTCFGGATRLPDLTFTGDNEALTKTDIENGLNVLTALKTWLDEAGQNRRLNLQKIRFVVSPANMLL